jgi:hypothetical protein
MGALAGSNVQVPRGRSILAGRGRILAALILSIPMCLLAPRASFAVPITVTCFGDTCPGALLSPQTAPLFMPFVFESPTGQSVPILIPGLTVVPGDVLLYNDPTNADLSDVLRFTGTAYILYSDPGDPMDTGIPILLPNQFIGLEDITGTIIYTVVGSLGTVTYTAISDGATPDIPPPPPPPPPQVPEPATLLLFGSALAGYAAMRRRPKIG